MPAPSFHDQCDRLSQIVDPAQFERLRWARNEGPVLETLVSAAHIVIAERPDLELAEEGSTAGRKRFILKVHGLRVAAINCAVADGQASVTGETVDRGKYRLAEPSSHTAAYADADAQWVEGAMQDIFSKIVA